MLNRFPVVLGWDRSLGALLAGALLGLATPAAASCKLHGQLMGPAEIESYRKNPEALLKGYPRGGQALQAAVTQIAARGAEYIDAVSSVVTNASGPQNVAIGRGFSAAVSTCEAQDSGIVQRIKDAVKQSGSSAMRRAFLVNTQPEGPAAGPGGAGPAAAQAPRGGMLPRDVFGNGRPEKLADPFGPADAWPR